MKKRDQSSNQDIRDARTAFAAWEERQERQATKRHSTGSKRLKLLLLPVVTLMLATAFAFVLFSLLYWLAGV